jgi:predicted secreted Zn-dependent protease
VKEHGFSDYVRTAEFHCRQVERALRDAAARAPCARTEAFASKQSRNMGQLRQVLPELRRMDGK